MSKRKNSALRIELERLKKEIERLKKENEEQKRTSGEKSEAQVAQGCYPGLFYLIKKVADREGKSDRSFVDSLMKEYFKCKYGEVEGRAQKHYIDCSPRTPTFQMARDVHREFQGVCKRVGVTQIAMFELIACRILEEHLTNG